MKPHKLVLVLTASALGGCLPVANYHSARTLADGESSWGMTFSSTTYTDADGDQLTIPGIIPEVTYHVGLTDDLEVGGRVAPGFLYGELDLKYRFVHTGDGLHLAVAPGLGQMALGVTVTTVRLPLLLTYELHPKIALNAGLNATMWNISGVDPDDDVPFRTGSDNFMTTTGGSIGVEFSGKTGFIRPSLEFSTAVIGGSEAEQEPLQIAAVVLHFGWISGREMKKLEDMDRKLDEINDKLSWRDRVKPTEQ